MPLYRFSAGRADGGPPGHGTWSPPRGWQNRTAPSIYLSNPDTSKFQLKLPNIAGVAFEEYSSIEDIYFSAEVDTSNLSSKSCIIGPLWEIGEILG